MATIPVTLSDSTSGEIVISGLVPVGELEPEGAFVRQPGSTTPIEFTWPADGLLDANWTTKVVRVDGGAWKAASGTITQMPTKDGEYWYAISIAAADWPTGEGRVVYRVSDGTNSLTIPGTITSTELVASAVAGHADFVTLFSRFTGITSLAHWLRAMTRKSTADATALAEINSGSGTFSVTRDSLEAQGAKTRLLGSGNATVAAPVADNGAIPVIYQGDDYSGSRVLSFTFNSSGYDITSATARFEAEPTQGSSFAATGTIADNGDGTATAAITITNAQSVLLETGPVYWSALNITSAGLRQTITTGDSPLETKKH